MPTRFVWHDYRYYPYEKELASREIAGLLKHAPLRETSGGLELDYHHEFKERLTYFAGYANGSGFVETTQSQLERIAKNGKKRQSTRYSVHGLHEYKGKFNPQVARAILNIFGVRKGQRVLDPFCGSGTTLVECAHLGAIGTGVDVNPLAVFVANAKLQALATPSDRLRAMSKTLSKAFSQRKSWTTKIADDDRGAYLKSWFDTSVLERLELVGAKVKDVTGKDAPIFLTILSNLLRDYSLQDPSDLRIRRRKSPLPTTPLDSAFLLACEQAIQKLEFTQRVLGSNGTTGGAHLSDIRAMAPNHSQQLFEAAITSPPYAMALPYIDTQRLSLVWLDLINARDVLRLEAELIGSRELRGGERHTQSHALRKNAAKLPDAEWSFCCRLDEALGSSDGFRRKAVPTLLYRYFSAMHESFRAVRSMMRPLGQYALIVGHNHTVLGGRRYDINTPAHLAALAEAAGWQIDELMPLQAYHRFGLHASNAVEAETLIFLRNRV